MKNTTSNLLRHYTLTAVLVGLSCLSSVASAAILYENNLQSNSDLTNLFASTGASIGTAPSGGSALTLIGNANVDAQSPGNYGGAISTGTLPTSGTGDYTISFDIEGACGSTACGALFYLNGTNQGISDGVPGGYYGTDLLFSLVNDSWENVTFTVASASEYLFIVNESNIDNSFYLKNLVITDAIGTLVSSSNQPVVISYVPVAPTFALLAAGFLALSGTSRRKATIAA